MAEIISSNSSRTGVAKSKKLSTRVDLTPMVDLGFLLITFFIFTTTMSQPKAMRLVVPDDSGLPVNQTPAAKTLSFVLGADNKIFYYKGQLNQSLSQSSYSGSDIRNTIIGQMNEVAAQYGDRTQTTILIKPTDGASYSNLIDLLDEMTINGVTRYVVMDVDAAELELVRQAG